ncbi:hypothetical protein VBD025_14335 [Virgibacillus flavescens]|uniref:hypothetical protein n=1 Tax=Virgibacillus flavescens TaxID=1611422 RepID=UPI003D34A04B
MEENYTEPKGFGEIISETFRLIIKHFKDFFFILLILIGPIFLIQVIAELVSGTDFLRESDAGISLLDVFNPNYEQGTELRNTGSNLLDVFSNLSQLILLSVAQVAFYHAVNHIRKNEEFTAGSVIKQAFSKFWPILGSAILFLIIGIGISIVPIIFVVLISIFASAFGQIAGVATPIVLAILIGLSVALLLIRWSFYLGIIAFEGNGTGFSESWHLTKGFTWKIFGLLLILSIITALPSLVLDFLAIYLLGGSALYGILTNLFSLFTALVFSVGYAVIFFDLKLRS